MESLFLLAFGEKEFLASPAMAGSKAFFNKLLVAIVHLPREQAHRQRDWPGDERGPIRIYPTIMCR
jgi:hypothetical protein